MSAGQSDRADQSDDNEPHSDEHPEMSDLYAQLEDLEKMVSSHAAREHVRETMRMAVDIGSSDVFGQIIRGYDRADIAESVLGALLFGIPMFVEGGTNEVGEFVATNPVYFVGTHVLTLGVVISIIYVADIQDVRVYRPIFGLVPRRLVGVITISFVIAVVMMTGWGRVSWTDPWLAVCTITVAYFPMSIGAALGDILPGS